MPVVVQKYGGSSVADVERIRQVARRVKARTEAGDRLVVVVSAMGDTTDELLSLARQVSADPPRRELDMLLTCGERISMALLSMALQDLGVLAISFTGSQSGIITDDAHSQARILEVRPQRIEAALEEGRVVIVAGYQGVSSKREVTTLGRGGSDTTAVALAAALGAEACEIYSDVDGVYSADPRVVPGAVKLAELSYEEMQALAAAGARVLNAQAVEFARQKGIVISARSTFGAGSGTQIRQLPEARGGRVRGIAAEPELLLLRAEPGVPLLELLGFLDARAIRARSFEGRADGGGQWVVPLADVHGIATLAGEARARFGDGIALHEGLGSVSCVGTGLCADFGVLRRALATAGAAGARVHGVHASGLNVSLLVELAHLPELTRRLHTELIG